MDGTLQTREQPACILCGSRGVVRYASLRDRMFGVSGSWSITQCVNQSCGLLWLNPMPVPADIGKAYVTYYTHSTEPAPRHSQQPSRFRQFLRRAKALHMQRLSGCPVGPKTALERLLEWPIRALTEVGTTFLPFKPGGRLLDVGCGAGAYLATMQELGWVVEGVEFDPQAVKAARQRGLNVNCGTVQERAYPSATFDAVSLVHVIEHLGDPVGTLQECVRILKPDGRLLLFTPNSESLGHRLFKQNWRGLEPPRHLFLFSASSMRRLLHHAGLADFVINPQVGSSLIYESTLLSRGSAGAGFGQGRQISARVFARAVALVETGLKGCKPDLSECMGVMAVKQ